MDWNVRRLLVAGWTNEVAILFASCAMALHRSLANVIHLSSRVVIEICLSMVVRLRHSDFALFRMRARVFGIGMMRLLSP